MVYHQKVSNISIPEWANSFSFFFFSKIKNIQFQGFVDEIDLWSIGQSVVRTRVNEKTFSDALFEPNPFGIIFIKILWEFPLYFIIG